MSRRYKQGILDSYTKYGIGYVMEKYGISEEEIYKLIKESGSRKGYRYTIEEMKEFIEFYNSNGEMTTRKQWGVSNAREQAKKFARKVGIEVAKPKSRDTKWTDDAKSKFLMDYKKYGRDYVSNKWGVSGVEEYVKKFSDSLDIPRDVFGMKNSEQYRRKQRTDKRAERKIWEDL